MRRSQAQGAIQWHRWSPADLEGIGRGAHRRVPAEMPNIRNRYERDPMSQDCAPARACCLPRQETHTAHVRERPGKLLDGDTRLLELPGPAPSSGGWAGGTNG